MPPSKAPIFAARLTPYRSLSRTGFLLLMGFIALTCFISGMMFLVIGAWPVFFFFGLDIFLIWGAFKLNYHSAKAFEEIAIWQDRMEFRQISSKGFVKTHHFNPYWTRFIVEQHDEIGVTRMALRQKGREIEIGSFLNPDDRYSFANAFGGALSTIRP